MGLSPMKGDNSHANSTEPETHPHNHSVLPFAISRISGLHINKNNFVQENQPSMFN